MSEQKNITRKDLFARIVEVMSDDPEVVAMCEKYIEQLSKPHIAKVKPEVEEFRQTVLGILRDCEDPVSNKEMCEKYRAQVGEVTAQKMAAALRWLVGNGDAQSFEPESKSGSKTYLIVLDDGGDDGIESGDEEELSF